MKGIDWKIVISSSEMKQTFALEVGNRFDALAESSDDIETTYNKLIQSTEEIALARNALLSAKKLCEEKPTKVNLKKGKQSTETASRSLCERISRIYTREDNIYI